MKIKEVIFAYASSYDEVYQISLLINNLTEETSLSAISIGKESISESSLQSLTKLFRERLASNIMIVYVKSIMDIQKLCTRYSGHSLYVKRDNIKNESFDFSFTISDNQEQNEEQMKKIMNKLIEKNQS